MRWFLVKSGFLARSMAAAKPLFCADDRVYRLQLGVATEPVAHAFGEAGALMPRRHGLAIAGLHGFRIGR
jgi:hypothetical protein